MTGKGMGRAGLAAVACLIGTSVLSFDQIVCCARRTNRSLTKYGRTRAKDSVEQRPIPCQTMLPSWILTSHLQEISETASRRLEQMMQVMAKAADEQAESADRGTPAGRADLLLRSSVAAGSFQMGRQQDTDPFQEIHQQNRQCPMEPVHRALSIVQYLL